MKLPWWIILGVGALVYFSRTASAVYDLLYEVKSFAIQKLKLASTQAELVMTLSNPAPTSLNFSELFIIVSYQGTQISTVTIPERIPVQGKSRRDVRIPMEFNNLSLITAGLDMIQDKIKKQQIKTEVHLRGSLKLNGVQYPIDSIVDLWYEGGEVQNG
ncbi:MAG: LEA type 2 family protein [Bacteroidota bacterium]